MNATAEDTSPRLRPLRRNRTLLLTEDDVEKILERLGALAAKLDAIQETAAAASAQATENARALAAQAAKVEAFWSQGPGAAWPGQLADHEQRLRALEIAARIGVGHQEGLRDGADQTHQRWTRAIEIAKVAGVATAGAGGLELLRLLASG